MNWKNILHYGGGAGLLALGIIGMLPFQIPGVHIDSATCFLAGSAALGIGAKADANAAKLMIALFAVMAFLAAPMAPARAADMVVKAPATPSIFTASTCTLTNCNGFYIGGNVANDGGNFDVIGEGLSGLASNGVMFGGQFGYEFWNGQYFAALEGDAEYNITSNMPNIGAGNSGQYALGAQVKVGYSLANAFGLAATSGAPTTLPTQLLNALMSPYAAVGVWDRPWGAGLATGAGVQALIATNWTLDAEYLHVNYNNAAINPNVAEQTENLFLLDLSRHF